MRSSYFLKAPVLLYVFLYWKNDQILIMALLLRGRRRRTTTTSSQKAFSFAALTKEG
jgi:hypothetical protein